MLFSYELWLLFGYIFKLQDPICFATKAYLEQTFGNGICKFERNNSKEALKPKSPKCPQFEIPTRPNRNIFRNSQNLFLIA